jgi:beta-xylosidase
MNKREYIKKQILRAANRVFHIYVILTLLPLQIFGATVNNEQKSSHKVTLVNRADLYIRDPFILPDSTTKTYYLYKSMSVKFENGQSRRGVVVYLGKDLQSWKGPTPVFHFTDGFWADRSIWAPEVHKYKGKYYLFVTFTSKDELPTPDGRAQNVKRATQILVADSATGPFKPFANKPHTPEDWMSLDGTLWIEDGIPYMVFCHEWWQITDGTMELVRLTDDLSDVVGEPGTLFKATDAKWVKSLRDIGGKQHGYVTDGPFLYRTKIGRLLMIWSSFGQNKYAVGLARSASDKVTGPWEQIEEPLLAANGGHGMIFKTFDSRLVMAIHQPNSGDIRAHLYELEDTGNSLRIKRELPLFEK